MSQWVSSVFTSSCFAGGGGGGPLDSRKVPLISMEQKEARQLRLANVSPPMKRWLSVLENARYKELPLLAHSKRQLVTYGCSHSLAKNSNTALLNSPGLSSVSQCPHRGKTCSSESLISVWALRAHETGTYPSSAPWRISVGTASV